MNIVFRRNTIAAIILLLAATFTVAQSAPSSQPPALLEIAHMSCIGADCDSHTTRIYPDGRFILEAVNMEKAQSGRSRKVSTRVETQLEKEEVAELVMLADQPDFLNAQAHYSLKIVQDNASWVTITYHNEGREKRIRVGNYLIASEAEKAKLPSSLLKLIEWTRKFPF